MSISYPDAINGCFELGGALLYILNVIKLRKDKAVRGVSIIPTILFTAWGYWNIFFYWHLGQWFSWAGGLAMITVNTTWLYLAWYYSHENNS